MRRDTVPSHAPSVPRFIIPCPVCGGQMIVAAVEPSPVLGNGYEDVTHCCGACGCAVTQAIAPPGCELPHIADPFAGA